MKIAMIGQKGLPATYGGVERHVQDLSECLASRGFKVTVYSRKWYTKKRGQSTVNGVRVIHTPAIHTKHLDAISHCFFSTVHALFSDYDIIHYHGVGPALVSWIPRIFSPKTKVVVTFHSIDRYHQKWNAAARWILRAGEWAACNFPHTTIAVSHGLYQYCLNEFHRETRYLPNGVLIPTAPEKETTLKKFKLEKNKYIVMVSRLLPHKGAHLLLEAFMNLKEKNPNDKKLSGLKLVFVGDAAVGTEDYVKMLKKFAGEREDVLFTSFQSGEALAELYANSLVLVHPSLNEGLPITVLNAMSYGRPALLSDIPEHREIIGEEACFFNDNSVRDLEKTLRAFLDLPQTAKTKLGRDNLNIIKRQYVWDNLVGEVIKTYSASKTLEKNKNKLVPALN